MTEPVVTAVARKIGEIFPELEGRSFAVTEVEISKDNLPRIPACMVALRNEVPTGTGGLDASNLKLHEDMIVEFWLPPVEYKKEEGAPDFGNAVLYAFYDYSLIRDRLLSGLAGWLSPQGAVLAYRKLELAADRVSVALTFSFSHIWNWCDEAPAPAPCDAAEPRKGPMPFRIIPQVRR